MKKILALAIALLFSLSTLVFAQGEPSTKKGMTGDTATGGTNMTNEGAKTETTTKKKAKHHKKKKKAKKTNNATNTTTTNETMK